MPDPITAITGGSAVLGFMGSRSASKSQERSAQQGMDAQLQMAREAQDFQRQGTKRGVNALQYGRGRALNNINYGADRNFRLQSKGYDQALDSNRMAYEGQQNYLNPMVARGDRASGTYDYNLGIGDRPDDYTGYENTQYQNYIMDQSQNALEGSAAARGGLFSGATIKAAQQNAQGLAGQFYGDYMNRIGGVSDVGTAARNSLANYVGQFGTNQANLQAQRGQALGGIRSNQSTSRANVYQQTAGGIANARLGLGNSLSNTSLGMGDAMQSGYAGIGNAQSAGTMGMTNALTGGLNNALGAYQYQQYAGSGGGAYAPYGAAPSYSQPMTATGGYNYGSGGGVY
jgi:hypothetical protein